MHSSLKVGPPGGGVAFGQFRILAAVVLIGALAATPSSAAFPLPMAGLPLGCPVSLAGLVPDPAEALHSVRTGDSVGINALPFVAELIDPLAAAHYGGREPRDCVDAGSRDQVIPFFDGVDLVNAYSLLPRGEVNDDQRSLLLRILANRAYGRYGSEWGGDIPRQLREAGLRITPADIDRAITEATSLDARPGIRVMVPHAPGEPGYIDPERVPNGPLLILQGNPILSGATSRAVRHRVEQLTRLEDGRRTTDAVMFLSDIHAGRPGGEERAFLETLDQLARNPPKMLVIGGDLIDAPNFNQRFDQLLTGYRWNRDGTRGDPLTVAQLADVEAALSPSERNELNLIRMRRQIGNLRVGLIGGARFGERMSTVEIEALRDARFERYARLLREKLPDTDIRFQLGNHDLPRLATLPRRTDVRSKRIPELGNLEVSTDLLPDVPLADGRLGANTSWQSAFRERFAANLRAVSPAAADRVLRMPEQQLKNLMKDFYLLKGDKFDDLHRFAYFDEAAGERVQAILAGHGIRPIGKRSDKYFELEIPNPDYVEGVSPASARFTKVLLVHEPQDKGPNANRIWKDKAVVSGGRTDWPPGTRVVVAFDQHAAGTVAFQWDGNPVGYHVVGSMTPNSNAGQRLMAAVIDPRGYGPGGAGRGNLYHVTFDDGQGGVGPARIADAKQIQYVTPPPATGGEPRALGSTTAPPQERPVVPLEP